MEVEKSKLFVHEENGAYKHVLLEIKENAGMLRGKQGKHLSTLLPDPTSYKFRGNKDAWLSTAVAVALVKGERGVLAN